MSSSVFFGKIPSDSLTVDPKEIALRLKTTVGYTDEITEKCKSELYDAFDIRYSYVKLPTAFPINGETTAGGFSFKSQHLYNNLCGCSEVFVFTVTLGAAVDRLIKRNTVVSPAKGFITDGLASAAAEAAADKVDIILRPFKEKTMRFSVGYGDLSIKYQKEILELTNAEKLLNVTLSDSFLMSPSKTVTAFAGIYDRR